MRTSTKAGIKATYFNQDVWKQNRLVIKIETATGYTPTKVSIYNTTNNLGSYGSPFATYALDSDGNAIIDVTDLIRTYGVANTVDTIYLYSDLATSSSDAIGVTFNIVGLIDPASVIIPYHPLQQYGALIVPPSKIITSLAQGDDETDAEFYATSGTWNVTGNASLAASKRMIGQINGAFTLSDGTHTQTFTPRERQCGIEYAIVRWESFTGLTRKHVFEVIKPKTENANNYSLLPIENEYIEVKGRVDGLTLRLTGLNAYDLWYYADVINSSKVELTLDGTNWSRVQVTTKSITIPDGEGIDGKLEININWKRYDAVAM